MVIEEVEILDNLPQVEIMKLLEGLDWLSLLAIFSTSNYSHKFNLGETLFSPVTIVPYNL